MAVPKLEKYNGNMAELPMQIRRYRVEDLSDLYHIDRICFDGDIAFSKAELLFYLTHAKSIARVAQEPDRILGFVLAQIESSLCAHILTLDVIPDARRQKVGTRLMRDLHKELYDNRVAIATLEVSTTNQAARRLYESFHYRYIQSLRGYYNGRKDAYRMACFIAQHKDWDSFNSRSAFILA